MIYAQPGATFAASVVGMPSGLTGTIGVRVINSTTGATAVARATAGISEAVASSGSYLGQLTAPSTPGRYLVEWDTGTVGPTTTAGEDLVVSTSVGVNGELVLVGSTVNFVGPVAASGDLTLVAGDDYATADSRQLKFIDSSGLWPVLTGATVALKISIGPGNGVLLSATGSVVTGTGANKEVDVALTKTQTLLLTPSVFYRHAVVATLTDANVVTLTRGSVTVLGQPS